LQYISVIGGGLAGCEAAHRIAREGINVKLWEMRPVKNTPVHKTSKLSELVCSNSLKSDLGNTAQGLLKREMRMLGSLLLSCAEKARIPAGSALAVDRELFSALVTDSIADNPYIEVIREEITELPEGEVCVVATGPLTSDKLSVGLQKLTGEENLYFYDAVAPSVTFESLDKNKIFKASRYRKGTDDYYNCPLTEAEYDIFYDNLVNADIKEGHSIDNSLFFSGCMPLEVLARRGRDTLRFGPMRPVGLKDPRTGRTPYAVVQLRQENKAASIYGLVGFQTRLRWGEQDRVFRLIPGLEEADFVRYGVMHRNTYINSPKLLLPTLQLRQKPNIFFAGQITGVEGYMESAATGIIAGLNAVRLIRNKNMLTLNRYTMIGALIDFITAFPGDDFQPVNANFGLLPPLEKRIKKKEERNEAYVARSMGKMAEFSKFFA